MNFFKFKQKCEEAINVEITLKPVNQTSYRARSQLESRRITSDGYQELKRKKRKVQVGTDDSKENEFVGRSTADIKDRKIWLFISKVKDTITTENVLSYIKRKTNSEEQKISVKELNTWFKMKDNKCFMVGVDPDFKNSVYNASFWPKGVAYRRFDFFKGQHFLDNPRELSGSTVDKHNQRNTTLTMERNDSFLSEI